MHEELTAEKIFKTFLKTFFFKKSDCYVFMFSLPQAVWPWPTDLKSVIFNFFPSQVGATEGSISNACYEE